MSEAELRQRLARFGFSVAAIDQAIGKCLDYDYLNDRRYALARTRSLVRSGQGVGRKILLDLKQRGIPEALAHEAWETVSAELPPETILRELLDRRFADFDYAQASDRERRRVIGYLQRRGFPLELIFAVLRDGDWS